MVQIPQLRRPLSSRHCSNGGHINIELPPALLLTGGFRGSGGGFLALGKDGV